MDLDPQYPILLALSMNEYLNHPDGFYQLRLDLNTDLDLKDWWINDPSGSIQVKISMHKFLKEKGITAYFSRIEVSSKGKPHLHSICGKPASYTNGNAERNWWKSKKRSHIILSLEQNQVFKKDSKKFQPVSFTKIKHIDNFWSYILKDGQHPFMSNIIIPDGVKPYCPICSAERTLQRDFSDHLKEQISSYYKNEVPSFGGCPEQYKLPIELYYISYSGSYPEYTYTEIGKYLHLHAIKFMKALGKPCLTPKNFWKTCLNNDIVSPEHYQNSKFGRLF